MAQRNGGILQFEESVGNLKHKNVGVSVVVDDEDAFDRAAHAIVLVVVLQTLQPGRDGGVLLGLGLLGAVDRRTSAGAEQAGSRCT